MNYYYLRSTLFITLAQGLLLLLLTMPMASAQTPGFLIRAGPMQTTMGRVRLPMGLVTSM
ncbi:hypothetical protein GO730_34780 [Spirosoma sp. HMF3257]|uniref:Uncharacterized protein n=1 Tax=Spirosoma telluris TaxID=2183553 RepID=A0A327NVU6_9BACT|nr:hypothetical protein [Spirosoma telluris]RAI77964.1 hypothetical protein HMF3257_34680 [Spirosoma telluris]